MFDFHFLWSYIVCLYIRKIIITWYFFFIINKQYVYIYMYVILNFQRCTVGMQKLVCIRKDTDTWFDILYR